MKKVYTAPQILFESFTMSTNIAGNCESIVGNPSYNTCGVPGSAPGMNLFTSSVNGENGCQMFVQESADDAFCYHNPTEYNNLFNS